MNLRKKTALIVLITFSILLAIVYSLSQSILLGSYKDLEQTQASENLLRILGTLQNEQSALESQVLDWGIWDASYEFIRGTYENYIDENLPDESFLNLRANLIMFINTSGELVYRKAFDLTEQQELPFPQNMEKHIGIGSPLMTVTQTKNASTGILILDETPLIISSGPILRTTGEGPVAGVLVMGRYLDGEEIDYLSDLTQVSFTIYQYNDSHLPEDTQEAIASLSMDKSMLIQPLSEDTISGYKLLPDIYGKPGLIIRMDMPRVIYHQGQQIINYFFIFMVISDLIVVIILVVLLEKTIISRLTRLRTHIKDIAAHDDLTSQVTILGNDEVSTLSHEINDMLKQIANSQQKLKEMEQSLVQSNKELKLNVEELEKFKEISVGRELKMVELKKQIKELEERLYSNK